MENEEKIDAGNDGKIDGGIDEVQKQRLLKRMAAGLVILAGLVGSLVLFDSMNEPEPPVAIQVAVLPRTESPAVAPPAVAPPAAAPTEVKPEDVAPARAADALPPPAAPEEKPLTRPATGRRVGLEPAGKEFFSDMRPEPASASSRPAAAPAAAAPAKSLATASPARPAVERDSPVKAPGGSAQRPFALQMGVFNNLANAEELRAKLERNGIPATIEARVHVGPFATRAEADAARLKLKELGMSESLLVVMKPRPAP
jgi:cell division septation protein DedD